MNTVAPQPYQSQVNQLSMFLVENFPELPHGPENAIPNVMTLLGQLIGFREQLAAPMVIYVKEPGRVIVADGLHQFEPAEIDPSRCALCGQFDTNAVHRISADKNIVADTPDA